MKLKLKKINKISDQRKMQTTKYTDENLNAIQKLTLHLKINANP